VTRRSLPTNTAKISHLQPYFCVKTTTGKVENKNTIEVEHHCGRIVGAKGGIFLAGDSQCPGELYFNQLGFG